MNFQSLMNLINNQKSILKIFTYFINYHEIQIIYFINFFKMIF